MLLREHSQPDMWILIIAHRSGTNLTPEKTVLKVRDESEMVFGFRQDLASLPLHNWVCFQGLKLWLDGIWIIKKKKTGVMDHFDMRITAEVLLWYKEFGWFFGKSSSSELRNNN